MKQRFRPPRLPLRSPVVLLSLLLAALAGGGGAGAGEESPNVLIITVDALRADRLSSYGCERPTTPMIDRLMRSGVRFTRARTVEPLTGPALASMLTSLYPHEHGASRNGLRVRTGLASLPKALQAFGYRTAAFVGNWTLRDKLSGLAEHFEVYEEVLTKKRWFGLVRREATADDITATASAWLSRHAASEPDRPFLAWVHYVEPHAPYELHRQYLTRLGLARSRNLTKRDRYDTEVAFVDASIGHLLRRVEELGLGARTVIVFAADHGESLGEHDYWGHGRHLYEPTLRIPMSIVWPGRIEPTTIEEPALNIDIAPTILGLLGGSPPSSFRGFDWTGVLEDGARAPAERITRHEAHRGAVISKHDSDLARRSGLLEVGLIFNDHKEIFRVQTSHREVYDCAGDPQELHNLADPKSSPTEGLMSWMRAVYDGLISSDAEPPRPLDQESIDQLRSLGYVD